jgi:uncharacterized protein (TIGR03032 family)
VSDAADAGSNPVEPRFRHVYSESFAAIVHELRITVLVSTYQSGKLVVVRVWQGQVSTLLRSFEQPMGLAVDGHRLAIGTRSQVWFFRDAPEIAPQLEPLGRHDACFLPRSSHVTGDIRGHEIAWAGGELWIVNTRFSCLCTLDPEYSFVPRWRPPFVSALAAEDRCHLNGLALADGRPRFVTVLGATDAPEGWRPTKVDGGCLIDVSSGAVVARGLCMPHSPRLHDGRPWLLDSGKGRVLVVDPRTGGVETVADLPGYTRGLAFQDCFAFVGLSKIRETSTFGGLPIAERLGNLKCGVWILDLRTGGTAGFLEFADGVEEIFDVQVLPGLCFPTVIGFQKETIHGAFVIPREGVTPPLGA